MRRGSFIFSLFVLLKSSSFCLFLNLYISLLLKEISPGISLEGMMLKLRVQYFGHLMRRADSLEKTLMLGGIGGKRRRGRQRMRWLDGITDSMDVFEWTPGVGDGQGSLACYDSWGRKESDTTEWLNWIELNWMETDLRGKPEILHFNLTSKDPKINEGDKFSRNNLPKLNLVKSLKSFPLYHWLVKI